VSTWTFADSAALFDVSSTVAVSPRLAIPSFSFVASTTRNFLPVECVAKTVKLEQPAACAFQVPGLAGVVCMGEPVVAGGGVVPWEGGVDPLLELCEDGEPLELDSTEPPHALIAQASVRNEANVPKRKELRIFMMPAAEQSSGHAKISKKAGKRRIFEAHHA
jgi:hypothetical protein